MRFTGLFAIILLSACGGSVTKEAETDAGSKADSSADTFNTIDSGFGQACSMPGMCALVPASCCGSCGVATRGDQFAIARDKASEYRTLACTTDGGAVGCPACAGFPDPELQAFCRGGSCVPVFVPRDEVSLCSTDDDCALVSGVCCGACDGERSLVAVAKSRAGEFASQICDPRVDCAPCAIPTPTTTIARCDPATKHCVAIRPL